ncbi:efflux RND transporter periplasmic adaptor subunit [Roseivivax sp. THAF197b]|uniref:efflux RND transporter periplasmic adaptor subunit n=1 Tax=Roseivivax sp. THAF197b TaxID=2588299 RepID=UPI001562D6AF|nr:efflux RND transporter periplasmic adaptor subunit [Roseivivax sp. THAF197b]
MLRAILRIGLPLGQCLALLALLSLPQDAQAQGGPASVATEEVTMRTMSETVSVFGEVVSGRQSAVAARVAGIVTGMPLSVGDRVSEGAILAQLDTEFLEIDRDLARAEIEIAEAGVTVASAQRDRAEKALRRAEALAANSTIAQAQFDERSGDYNAALGAEQQARARIQAAETALAQAEYRLENATIFAPFDAVLLEVTAQKGEYIGAGAQVATLLDLGATEVEANVPARFVPALRDDQPVEARTDAGGALDLRLRAILPTEFAATRTRPVRFAITSTERDVAVGQSVTLDVPISAPREVIVVPKDALVQGRDGWSVFINADGKAQPRTVEIGAALDGGFEVISGLAPGDEVVVRGNERLRPGQDIAPANGGSAPGGNQAGASAPAPDTADAEDAATPPSPDAAEGGETPDNADGQG